MKRYKTPKTVVINTNYNALMVASPSIETTETKGDNTKDVLGKENNVWDWLE